MVASIDILSVFSLGFELEAQIQGILDGVLTTPERIALVEETIESIIEIDEAISSEQSNPNYALIKADVLEWQGGGSRTAGMENRKLQLLIKLSNLLGLEDSGILWRKIEKGDILTGWII